MEMVESEESEQASPSIGKSDGLDDPLFDKSIVNSPWRHMGTSEYEIKLDSHSEDFAGKKFISPAALKELNDNHKPLSDK